MKTPPILQTISKAITEHAGRAVLVGGAVRDIVMGHDVKDYDIEVFGIGSMHRLGDILSQFGSVNEVGRSFGILKLRVGEMEYDFALPRKERKSGRGHRGFDVEVDGTLSFAEAARRRDFTVNAVGYDLLGGKMLDPYNGLGDIRCRVLRHIDAETFVEDPLRVYRAVQFAARFGMEVAEETAALCKKMVGEGMLEELPKERVYLEWQKLLLKASKPSIGFELMREWGILERYFPELNALIGVPQDPKWHPEGDVWVHTMMSIDAMAHLVRSAPDRREKCPWGEERGVRSEKGKLKLLFAVLCHDLGKPSMTTIEIDQSSTEVLHTDTPHSKVRAIGHETAGLEPTRSFMYRLSDEHDFIESILPLVEHHLKPSQFYKQGTKSGAIRRLATKVNIEELVLVAKADFFGRTTEEAKHGRYKAGEWLLEKAKSLKVHNRPLDNVLRGRDLIALGMRPSPKFKKILDEVYALQMEGKINNREEALEYLKNKNYNFI